MTMFQNLHRTLKPDDTLKLKCGRCGHQREWPANDAMRIYGGDAAPYDIDRVSKCGSCGEKRRISIWI